MRCSNCNKFPSFEMADPEVNNVEVEADDQGNAKVTADVRIALKCADCGDELKEYNFEVEKETQVPACGHELGVSYDEPEALDEFEGRGRIKKHFYGFRLVATVDCPDPDCDSEQVEVELTDRVQSSYMEEL